MQRKMVKLAGLPWRHIRHPRTLPLRYYHVAVDRHLILLRSRVYVPAYR